MKAARAQASAQRKAEQAEWRRQVELRCEVRRLALNAVKAGIRARGDKVQLYSHASLQAMANELITPFLIEQVRASLRDRTGHSLSQTVTTAPQQGEVSQ